MGFMPEETTGHGPDNDTAGEDNRRRMREALERKKSSSGVHIGPSAQGSQHLKGSSDQRQRQFRRKSG